MQKKQRPRTAKELTTLANKLVEWLALWVGRSGTLAAENMELRAENARLLEENRVQKIALARHGLPQG